MHKRLIEGVDAFNSARYYDAHEAWEDVWRESIGAERLWLQGLVQVAVALHHASTGNLVGARSVLARALRNLQKCPADLRGVDIDDLRVNLGESQTQLLAEKVPSPFLIRTRDR